MQDAFIQAASGIVDMGYFGLILMYGYVMVLVFNKYKLDKRLMVAAFAFANLAVCVLFQTDIALVETARQNFVLPYGKLWVLMNPYWQTEDLYKYLIFGWETVQLLLLWVFGVRRGKVSWDWVIFSQLFDLNLFMVKNPQSVVPMMFVFLTPLFAPSLVGFFLTKLPIGYSTSSPEWRCIFGNLQSVLVLPTDPVRYIPVCGRFTLSMFEYPALVQGYTLYAMFLSIVAYMGFKYWVRPILWRFRK